MIPLDQDALRDLFVLVVEDEFLLADEICEELRAAGAEVIGPAPSLAMGLRLVEGTERLHYAVLDLNLGGQYAFPIARRLKQRQIPFVFTTGYDRAVIPAEFQDVPRFGKPMTSAEIIHHIKLDLAVDGGSAPQGPKED